MVYLAVGMWTTSSILSTASITTPYAPWPAKLDSCTLICPGYLFARDCFCFPLEFATSNVANYQIKFREGRKIGLPALLLAFTLYVIV